MHTKWISAFFMMCCHDQINMITQKSLKYSTSSAWVNVPEAIPVVALYAGWCTEPLQSGPLASFEWMPVPSLRCCQPLCRGSPFRDGLYSAMSPAMKVYETTAPDIHSGAGWAGAKRMWPETREVAMTAPVRCGPQRLSPANLCANRGDPNN